MSISPLSYRMVKILPANLQDNEFVVACNGAALDWNAICGYLEINQLDVAQTTKNIVQTYVDNTAYQNNYILLTSRQEPVYKFFTRKPDKGARMYYVLDMANKKAYVCYNMPFQLHTTTAFENALSFCGDNSEDNDTIEFKPNWDAFGDAVNSRTKIKQDFDDDYDYYVQYNSFWHGIIITRTTRKGAYLTQVFYPDTFTFESGTWDGARLSLDYRASMHSLLLFLSQHSYSHSVLSKHVSLHKDLVTNAANAANKV